MDDRTNDRLDGEFRSEALSDEGRLELESFERTTREVARYLRSRPTPDLTASIMSAIAAEDARSPRHRVSDVLAAFLRPLWKPFTISVQLRPAYLGAIAVAGMLFLSATRVTTPGSVADAVPSAAKLYVQFRLDAPGAGRVDLAGSFTGWEPAYSLHETAPGTWTAVVPVDPGVHDYLFVIDGVEWVPDPMAYQVQDDFGGVNSRLLLTAPDPET